MKKRAVPLVLFLFFLVMSSSVFAAPVVHDPAYSIELVASDLGAAHGVEIGPTEDIFVSNDEGSIFRINKVTYAVETYASGFSHSLDLTFDNLGNLFVLSGDGSPRSVFQVYSDGTSDLFSTGYSHTVGLEAGPDGYLYLGNTGDGTISKVDSSGVGTTFLLGLFQPRGLSFDDSGNLYFVETATGNISRSTLDGSVTLVATLGPSRGTFVEVDSSGVVYVSDDPTASIYRIYGSSVTPFASDFVGNSDPPALGPLGLEFDSQGNLFVADGKYLWKISLVVKPIMIDIKPFSWRNLINRRGRGCIPVAILSDGDFDATSQVDRNSLTFGSTGEEDSLVRCLRWGIDVDRNGYRDLFCFFRNNQSGFQCGDEEGILKGQLLDGTPIEGSDSVRIWPCR